MLNEKFIGEIQNVTAWLVIVKLADGTKAKQSIHKIKLASADIDYEVIAKFNPNISATLLNIQPMPFKSINFGDQSAFRMKIDVSSKESETEPKTYINVLIKNLTIKIKENIPVYHFALEIPGDQSAKFLTDNLKCKIEFEFGKME